MYNSCKTYTFKAKVCQHSSLFEANSLSYHDARYKTNKRLV